MRFWFVLLALICGALLSGCRDHGTDGFMPLIPSGVEEVSGNNQVGVVGTRTAEPMVVRVVSADGLGVGDVWVTFEVFDGQARRERPWSQRTKADGTARFGFRYSNTPGAIRVLVTVAGVEGASLSLGARSVAGDANVLRAVSGDMQVGIAGELLGEPLVMSTLDMYGNPARGSAIDIVVVYGSGTTSQEVIFTDANGEASVWWTLGPEAGAHTVRATAREAAGYPVTYRATALPGTPAEMNVMGGDQQYGFSGEQLESELVVQLQDQFGNPTPDVVVASTDRRQRQCRTTRTYACGIAAVEIIWEMQGSIWCRRPRGIYRHSFLQPGPSTGLACCLYRQVCTESPSRGLRLPTTPSVAMNSIGSEQMRTRHRRSFWRAIGIKRRPRTMILL
jgi:hypothetical protein